MKKYIIFDRDFSQLMSNPLSICSSIEDVKKSACKIFKEKVLKDLKDPVGGQAYTFSFYVEECEAYEDQNEKTG